MSNTKPSRPSGRTTPRPRNKPRDINGGRDWYYVNQGSVDLVADGKAITRLSRKVLTAMLAELKPLNASQQEQD